MPCFSVLLEAWKVAGHTADGIFGTHRSQTASRSTRVISAGHAFIQNLRRGHYELGINTDPKRQLPAAFTELAIAI